MALTLFQHLLCRAVFEEEGKFVPSVLHNKVTEEEFYESIGFESSKKLSAKQVFTLMRDAFAGSTEAEDLLKKNSITLPVSTKAITTPKVRNENLIRLLALYIRDNKSVEIEYSKNIVLVSDYIKFVSLGTHTATEMSKILKSELISKKIIPALPKVVHKEGVTPIILRGKFLVPTKMSDKEISELYTAALTHACCKFLDVPSATYFKVMKCAAKGQRVSKDDFLSLFGYAVKTGGTIKNLFELCGLTYVSRLAQYKAFDCLVYRETDSSCRLYTSHSETEKECIALPDSLLEWLNDKKLASKIYWENGVATVDYQGQKIPVELLGGN